MGERITTPTLLGAAVLIVIGAGWSTRADAGCNLIPGTTKTFNATLGTTNRPFAAPGEALEIAVRPCDAASLGLTANASDHRKDTSTSKGSTGAFKAKDAPAHQA